MAEPKVGDSIVRKDHVGKIVGFNGEGGAIVERGDFFALVVEPISEIRTVEDTNG